MDYKLKILRYNSHSVLMEWPKEINKTILNDVLNFKYKLNLKYIKQKIEVIDTYCSLLIIYNCTIDDFYALKNDLNELYIDKKMSAGRKIKRWSLPVCYDASLATDLPLVSETLNLSPSTVIKMHTDAIYTIYFMGFLPGFPYLGGLDKRLYIERKSNPNLRVKKGSVAIAQNQTGIYPQESPGGWHVIGNTPITLFNSKKHPSTHFNSGDELVFYPLEKSEYMEILSADANGTYLSKFSIVND